MVKPEYSFDDVDASNLGQQGTGASRTEEPLGRGRNGASASTTLPNQVQLDSGCVMSCRSDASYKCGDYNLHSRTSDFESSELQKSSPQSLRINIYSVPQVSERKNITVHEASVMKIELIIAYMDKDGDNELLLAAIKGIEDYVIILINCLVKRKCQKYLNLANDMGQTILYLTVYKNMLRATKLLSGIEQVELDTRDNKGNTPLHLACQKGYLYHVKALTLPVKKVTNTPVISQQRSELTELEAERRLRQTARLTGRQVVELKNYSGWNCLHVAVMSSHISVVEYLVLTLKMDPNCPGGSRGMTPLHIAVENDDIPMVIFFIRRAKADVNALTYDKWSPVQFATFKKKPLVVKMLVTNKAHLGDIKYCQTLLTSQASAQDDDDDDDDDDEEEKKR